jgi:hypothetical protein
MISLIAACGAVLLSLTNLQAEPLLQPDDIVLVAAAVRPDREMVSVDIATYLLACQPVPGIRVVQSCQREDSVEGFMKRVETDVTPWQPNIVLTSHGTGEGFNAPDSRGVNFYYPTYLGATVDLIKKLGARKMVVSSPHNVDSVAFQNNPTEAKRWNMNLATFRDKAREVAEMGGVQFADMQDVMLATMTKAKAARGDAYSFLGTDGITPDPNGQLIMAYVFLKALGCDGSIGTITVDLTSGKAEGSEGQKILSSEAGTIEIESTRYPFCFKGTPEQAGSTAGIIPFLPFNEDLNRYLLVVRGLTGTKAKITWGKESREFSNQELEAGVNLAEAFAVHTPFDAQFAKVEAAVWAQQQKHTLFASFFHNLRDFKAMTPASTDSLDKIAAGIIQQDKVNASAAVAQVIPVRHTLKIEALP